MIDAPVTVELEGVQFVVPRIVKVTETGEIRIMIHKSLELSEKYADNLSALTEETVEIPNERRALTTLKKPVDVRIQAGIYS